MARHTVQQLKAFVDKLGRVKAHIAKLQEMEEEYKKALIKSGKDAIDGDLFRAAIIHTDGKEKVDYKAVLACLAADDPKLLSSIDEYSKIHTSTGKPSVSVRCMARSTSGK